MITGLSNGKLTEIKAFASKNGLTESFTRVYN